MDNRLSKITFLINGFFLNNPTYGLVVNKCNWSSLWLSEISWIAPLAWAISPKEPCFIIKILDIDYVT